MSKLSIFLETTESKFWMNFCITLSIPQKYGYKTCKILMNKRNLEMTNRVKKHACENAIDDTRRAEGLFDQSLNQTNNTR